jgi:serine protease Do
VQGYVAGRPDLGVEGDSLSSFYQHYYHLPSGPVVSWVDPDSDAWARGIREGDILLYLNEQRLSGPGDYQRLVNSLEVGSEVSLMIYRNGKEFERTIKVGEYTSRSVSPDGFRRYPSDSK